MNNNMSVVRPGDSDFRGIFLSPELGKRMIPNIGEHNLNWNTVRNFMRMMKKGLWRKTHQSVIARTPEGMVVDGIHRIAAVVLSGVTIPTYLYENADPNDYPIIDSGQKRSVLKILRREFQDNTIKLKHLQVLRAFLAGMSCRSLNCISAIELISMYKRYGAYVRMVTDVIGLKEDTTLTAVLVRAALAVPFEHVAEFCKVYRYGMKKHYSAEMVMELRDRIYLLPDHREATRRDIYQWAETVFIAFVEGKRSCRIKQDMIESFPLSILPSKTIEANVVR